MATDDPHAPFVFKSEDKRWWLACQHPERPADEWVIWVWACDACILAMTATAAAEPTRRADVHDDQGRLMGESTVKRTLSAALKWRAEHGYSAPWERQPTH